MNSEPRGTCGRCETYSVDGSQCLTLTVIRCAVCDRPVCARCAEDSWLNDWSETCPKCWERRP